MGETGMGPYGQVQVIGTLKNVSGHSIEYSEIAYLFDDHQVAFDFGGILLPSEERNITKGFPGYSENTKILEVRV